MLNPLIPTHPNCRCTYVPTYGDEEYTFIAAINATPNDHAPYLVFADWLEERDQPEKAELLRIHCQLVGTPIQCILVVAGSYEQYCYWCREWPKHARVAQYVCKEEHLVGLHDCIIVHAGQWQRNPLAFSDRLDYAELPLMRRGRELLNKHREWSGFIRSNQKPDPGYKL